MHPEERDEGGPVDAADHRAWARSLLGAEDRAGVDGGVATRLRRLARGMAVALPAQGVSIDLRSQQGGEAVVAASGEAARAHARLGLDVGEGPAHDAFGLGRPVLVADLRDGDARWWAYCPAAREAGLGAVFAIPLQQGAARFGVLNVYEDRPRRLDAVELARVLTVAELVTELLLDSVDADHGDHGGMDPHLEGALAFRNEVYQAQGMVMARLGTTLPSALARMRAHAFAAGRELTDVSLDIVAGDLRLDDDLGHQHPRDLHDRTSRRIHRETDEEPP